MSGTIKVTPQTAAELLKTISDGTTVIFEKGVYTDPLILDGKKNIRLVGQEGVIIRSAQAQEAGYFEAVRKRANEFASDVRDAGRWPTLAPHIHEGRLQILNSQDVTIEGHFHFQSPWMTDSEFQGYGAKGQKEIYPTHIYIGESQRVAINSTMNQNGRGSIHMDSGTYAIAASGAQTQGVSVNGVSWHQDARIWDQIHWKAIHENHPERGVLVDHDWRIFDGGFFTGSRLAGTVDISNVRVTDAYNGVRVKHSQDLQLTVTDSQFTRIRDNTIEPEEGVKRAFIERNTFVDNYKPLALESKIPGVYRHVAFTDNEFIFNTRPSTKVQHEQQQRYLDLTAQHKGQVVLHNQGLSLFKVNMRSGSLAPTNRPLDRPAALMSRAPDFDGEICLINTRVTVNPELEAATGRQSTRPIRLFSKPSFNKDWQTNSGVFVSDLKFYSTNGELLRSFQSDMTPMQKALQDVQEGSAEINGSIPPRTKPAGEGRELK